MAIVINTNPTTNASVNNEMLFVVYEATKANDDVTYPDYTYVLDLYVDAVLIGRLKSRPDPEFKRGIFDVSAMLRSYMTYGLKANYANTTENYTPKISYTAKFGEEYSFTLYTNLTVDSEREAYRSYELRPFEDTDVMGDVTGDFATVMPSTIVAYKSAKWQLLPFWSNVSGISNFEYKFYDSGGAQIGSTGTISAAGYVAKNIFQMNAGFVKLAGLAGLSAAQQESADYYEITGNSKAKRMQLKCTKYPVQTIVWLNKFGAYMSQQFGLVSKKTNESSRKTYGQLNYKINASGIVSYSADGVYYGGKKAFSSLTKTTLKLTSHLLSDGEYTWMADLFAATDVYIYHETLDRFVPVTVMDNNYEIRTYLNSRLKPLEFSVEFTDEYNAQYL